MVATAAYARYSTDLQREASIDDQLRNIRAHCERVGWPAPTVFSDAAMSGTRSDRPAYQRLMRAIDGGKVDILLVDEFSRLGRDLGESWHAIQRCQFRGVRVIGVVDGTDTERRGYKIETGLRGLMAEHERDEIAWRTHRGLTGRALAGLSAGGLPYGYRSIDTGDGHRREIDPDQAHWVRYIYERAAAGQTPRQIAIDLNAHGIPSPRGGTWVQSAIYGDRKRGIGILGNSIYIGRWTWNRSQWIRNPKTKKRQYRMRPESEWIITQHPELRIISDELWQAVETRRRRNGPLRGRRSSYLFSGLLKCGQCGGSYVIVDRYRYGCATHKDRGTCDNRLAVARAIVEDRLLAAIQRELLSDDCFRAFERAATAALRAARPDPSAARKALARAQTERDNIVRALRAGIITPTTKTELERAEAAVTTAEQALAAIDTIQPAQILPRARETYRRLVADLADIKDVEQARDALRELLGEIKLMPEGKTLVAELTNQACQIDMVAGAGYGHYLTAPIRIRLLP